MGNVTKKDIVDEIAARTGLTQVDTKIIVECFLNFPLTQPLEGLCCPR